MAVHNNSGSIRLVERHRNTILRELDVNKIIPHLVQKAIFSLDEENKVYQEISGVRRVEIFLDIILRKSSDAYREFCLILELVAPHLLTCFLLDNNTDITNTAEYYRLNRPKSMTEESGSGAQALKLGLELALKERDGIFRENSMALQERDRTIKHYKIEMKQERDRGLSNSAPTNANCRANKRFSLSPNTMLNDHRSPNIGLLASSTIKSQHLMPIMENREFSDQGPFFRDKCWVWLPYNHLILKVRSDGRPFMINISREGEFDVTWSDIWSYILFTRGGPYWQIVPIVKIPFSKFFLANHGRFQDKQEALPITRITRFGITLGDKAPGPFQLEIDYIGLYYDPSHTELFAYELYQTPKYVVN